ncbi:MAG: hypothetical protein RJB08_1483, partial [Actinomycetota bacterium]
DPEALTGQTKVEALNYKTKMTKYSSDQKLNGTGFATQGYTGIMNIWAVLNEVGGVKATGEDVRKGFKQTKNHHAFGGAGISCQDATKPYVAVCASLVSASQWNGSALKAVKTAQDFSGLTVVGKGDALRTTEVK